MKHLRTFRQCDIAVASELIGGCVVVCIEARGMEVRQVGAGAVLQSPSDLMEFCRAALPNATVLIDALRFA